MPIFQDMIRTLANRKRSFEIISFLTNYVAKKSCVRGEVGVNTSKLPTVMKEKELYNYIHKISNGDNYRIRWYTIRTRVILDAPHFNRAYAVEKVFKLFRVNIKNTHCSSARTIFFFERCLLGQTKNN